ncbi:MAG: hypothetical protein EPN47_03490 [Acidobacteria bacterium]|nr:MAG: hypothetical protein EPN47_03490 [Acidobacteriota bacterium]
MISAILPRQSMQQDLAVRAQCEDAVRKLVAYCCGTGWAGYDPYDALNSRIFGMMPFLGSRLPRLILTQTLKRSPLNLRRMLLVEKAQNPKAMALFLSAFVRLGGSSIVDAEGLARLMIERLIALRSQGTDYWCWGYSFPWQMRKDIVPRWAPNLVCTTFVANALLDAYESSWDPQCLKMASSAAEYILTDLYWKRGPVVAGFSYPRPDLRAQVYNANFLAAALLCRVYRHTGEERLLGPALAAARYSAAMQFPDGSWTYGEMPSQHWIDNFHTGFNLCALQSIGRNAGTAEFEPCLRRGLDFYRAHFFCEDGAVRYFYNRTYPIDIHCVAQAMITLVELEDLDPGCMNLAQSVFQWAMAHMWDDRGFFYYRVLRYFTNRISYIRWSQAWMLLAMATLLSKSGETAGLPQQLQAPASVEA